LKYAGPMPGKLALLLWMEGWDKDADRNYYIWAIKGKDETIFVDTGCSLTLASERKLKDFVNPVDLLARIGADKTNVKKVFITHLHWDHLGGIELFLQAFPEAVFYVQEKEFGNRSLRSLNQGGSRESIAVCNDGLEKELERVPSLKDTGSFGGQQSRSQ